MKVTHKHGIVAIVCVVCAVVLFASAVWWGAFLLEKSEQPMRLLLNRMMEEAGKATPQNIIQPDVKTKIRIIVMIAALAASAGFGLARAFDEFRQCLRLGRNG